MSESVRIHKTAEVSASSTVSESARIWQYAHVREESKIGENVVIGRGAYIGPGVSIGHNSKIQNYALIYGPAVIDDGVFIGPAAVLTNDKMPRAINPDESQKVAEDWSPAGVHIQTGASIGANATCIGPLTIGKWALVGAGAVVTKDVPNFALVIGVPARRIGWVGKAGVPLKYDSATSIYSCPSTGSKFRMIAPEELAEDEK